MYVSMVFMAQNGSIDLLIRACLDCPLHAQSRSRLDARKQRAGPKDAWRNRSQCSPQTAVQRKGGIGEMPRGGWAQPLCARLALPLQRVKLMKT